jgi:hypothetical protein
MSTDPQNLQDEQAEPGQALVTRADNPFDTGPIVAAPTGSNAAALAQREIAEIQAALTMAAARPRNQRLACDRILTSCARPALAEGALYRYVRGGTKVEGPSIRLAEEFARQWGNMLCGVTEISRHGGHSECLAYAWDLETNFRDEKRFTVRHWRDTREGGYALSEERDIYEVIANMGARRKRACILALIPGDVTEAAVRQVKITLETNVKLTPERIKNMAAAFLSNHGVTKEMIEKRIQCHLEAMTPALFVQLNSVINSLKDGMSSPGDWFEMPEADKDKAANSTTERVRDKLAAATKEKK